MQDARFTKKVASEINFLNDTKYVIAYEMKNNSN